MIARALDIRERPAADFEQYFSFALSELTVLSRDP
jgi:hypothetical protein